MDNNIVTIETEIKAPIEKVWEYWTSPDHITKWNFASEDWCCPQAINEVIPGKKFSWRMEAKDGSMGFDLIGTYDKVEKCKSIEYHLDDNRKVVIDFIKEEDRVKIVESFETEDIHTPQQQREGWKAILENFKKHVESNHSE